MNNLLRKKGPRESSFAKQAELAFKEAVADAIEDHRLAGNPIAVLRAGKVVLLPPEQIKPLLQKNRRTTRVNFRLLRLTITKPKRARAKVFQMIVAARKLTTRT
jgi:hypothetical protein